MVFTAAAAGVPALNYQWQKNGTNLTDGGNVSGSATAALTVSNVRSADMAAYGVVVTNPLGSATSFAALLDVMGPPVILSQPASRAVNYGATAQFSVTVLGWPAPSYIWWWNGTNALGGNDSTLTLPNVARAQDGAYSVSVTNASGAVLSSNAMLTVLVPQVLGAPGRQPDGSWQLSSSDLGGGALPASAITNFTVQTSTNLVNWAVLPNALSWTNGKLRLQDPGTNGPLRFYRIIEQ